MKRAYGIELVLTVLIVVVALAIEGAFSTAHADSIVPTRRKCTTERPKYVAASATACFYGLVIPTCAKSVAKCGDTGDVWCYHKCLWGSASAVAYNGPFGAFKDHWAKGLGLAGPRTAPPLDFSRFTPGALPARDAPPMTASGPFADPGQCTISPWSGYGHALMSPGTQSGIGQVTVTVRDAGGNPLPGVDVEIQTTEACPEARGLCVDPVESGLAATTDAAGVAVLDPQVGGCASCDVAVRADGVTLAVFPGIRSPDWDGTRADGIVDAADLSYFQAALLSGSADECADLNGDGVVTAADLALVAPAYVANDSNSEPCAPLVDCCQGGQCVRVPQTVCEALGGSVTADCATCVAPDTAYSSGVIESPPPVFDPVTQTIDVNLGIGRFVATKDSTYATLELRVWVPRDEADTVSTDANTIWAGKMLNLGGVVSYLGGFSSSDFVTGDDGNTVWVEIANAQYGIPFYAPGGQGSFDDVEVESVVDGGPIQFLTADVANPVSRPATLRATPNPFSASTRIFFVQTTPGPARLGIFDASGRRVRVLETGRAGPGPVDFEWDGRDAQGRDVPPGFYYIRGPGDSSVRVGKIVRVE